MQSCILYTNKNTNENERPVVNILKTQKYTNVNQEMRRHGKRVFLRYNKSNIIISIFFFVCAP